MAAALARGPVCFPALANEDNPESARRATDSNDDLSIFKSHDVNVAIAHI